MKKLLLILICLFVYSCEDDDGLSDEEFLEDIKNSQSDDLDGKKLLCYQVSEKGSTNKKSPLIFEFLSNFSVSVHFGWYFQDEPTTKKGRYKNTLEQITIKLFNNVSYSNYIIDRQNLQINYFDSGRVTVVPSPDGKGGIFRIKYYECNLFWEDTTIFFKKHYDKVKKEKIDYINKLKSKQKI